MKYPREIRFVSTIETVISLNSNVGYTAYINPHQTRGRYLGFVGRISTAPASAPVLRVPKTPLSEALLSAG
jgi:hypothetical protein